MNEELGEVMALRRRKNDLGFRLNAAKKIANKELMDKIAKEIASIDRSIKSYEEIRAKTR